MYQLYTEEDVLETYRWIIRTKESLKNESLHEFTRMSLEHNMQNMYEQLEVYEQYGKTVDN